MRPEDRKWPCARLEDKRWPRPKVEDERWPGPRLEDKKRLGRGTMHHFNLGTIFNFAPV